ncbi:glutathione S-transferase family protein YghU, partial [Acidithiobacillus sp. GGI-221]
AYAPTKIEYAINRFAMEAKRQLDVLDKRLSENEYIVGREYTIADMAIWPWYGGLVKGWLYDAAEFLSVEDYPNVQRWAENIYAALRCSAGSKSTVSLVNFPVSCMNGMMRVTFICARKTSS